MDGRWWRGPRAFGSAAEVRTPERSQSGSAERQPQVALRGWSVVVNYTKIGWWSHAPRVRALLRAGGPSVVPILVHPRPGACELLGDGLGVHTDHLAFSLHDAAIDDDRVHSAAECGAH